MIAGLPKKIAVVSGLILMLALIVCGQTPGTGAIRGTVLDPAGHPLSDATVEFINLATRVMRTAPES